MFLWLIVNMFILTINTLFVKLRGKVTVFTAYTNNDYNYSWTEKRYGQDVSIDFNCKQISHRICYEKWWFLNEINYTYLVEAVKSIEDKIIGKSTGSFPHMTFKILHRTKHPHRRAINAMIDCFR